MKGVNVSIFQKKQGKDFERATNLEKPDAKNIIGNEELFSLNVKIVALEKELANLNKVKAENEILKEDIKNFLAPKPIVLEDNFSIKEARETFKKMKLKHVAITTENARLLAEKVIPEIIKFIIMNVEKMERSVSFFEFLVYCKKRYLIPLKSFDTEYVFRNTFTNMIKEILKNKGFSVERCSSEPFDDEEGEKEFNSIYHFYENFSIYGWVNY